jgi:hypothetical protein
LNYYPKTYNFTICSIYGHGGHYGWSAGSSDINFKGTPLRMIQARFSLNRSSGFRGEDFWKSLQTGDGCQVMAIAHTGELKKYICYEIFINFKCIHGHMGMQNLLPLYFRRAPRPWWCPTASSTVPNPKHPCAFFVSYLKLILKLSFSC